MKAKQKAIIVSFLMLFPLFMTNTGESLDKNVSNEAIQIESDWEHFLQMMRNASHESMSSMQNALLCGYVKDEETGNAIENATVYVFHDNALTNLTTDRNGFYSIYLEAGKIYIYCNALGYYFKNVGSFDIKEYETLWINISMKKAPPQNSVVCGYIKDKITNDKIENARVESLWRDSKGNIVWNTSHTDEKGLYEIKVPAGNVSISAYAPGYLWEGSNIYFIKEGERFWIIV